MSTRSLVVASLSMSLLPVSESAFAQNAPGQAQNLPPITVTQDKPSTRTGRDQTAKRRVRSIPTVLIYPTSPLADGDVEADKVPAAVTVVDSNQIKTTGSLNISDALVKYVPGITINEVSGNPFQPDVQFRGFTASPVSGTPQGLAVYQNG